MKPEVPEVLGMLAANLVTNVVPRVDLAYVAKDAELMVFLLMAAAEEFDRAAELRFRENGDLRGLFGDAAQQVDDTELGQRLEDAAGGEDTSLTVSALTASNADLRALLIDLHEHVETAVVSGAPWADALDRRIWDFLQTSVQRRAFSFYPG